MDVSSLLEEYDLSLDDVRWYLSRLLADSLLTHKDDPKTLAHRIWSGSLEAELYNLEENHLTRLRDELDRGLLDAQTIREEFEAARIMKIQRARN